MNTKAQRPKERNGTISSLNVAIDTLNLARDISGIAPAQVAFGSVSTLLTMIRVRFALFCTDKLLVDTYPGFHGE